MDQDRLDNLDNLFTSLDRGDTPTCLEMMLALSDVSEIWPGKDSTRFDSCENPGQCRCPSCG